MLCWFLVEANAWFLLIEVPIRDIMIKTNALDAAKLSENRQNLLLLFGRQHVLTVMRPIVWPVPATE